MHAFPVMRAGPEQARILPIGDDPKVLDYSMSILNKLRRSKFALGSIRARTTSTAKSSASEQMKVHTMFFMGKRDMEAIAVSIRVHGKGNLDAKPRAETIADILQAIRQRSA